MPTPAVGFDCGVTSCEAPIASEYSLESAGAALGSSFDLPAGEPLNAAGTEVLEAAASAVTRLYFNLDRQVVGLWAGIFLPFADEASCLYIFGLYIFEVRSPLRFTIFLTRKGHTVCLSKAALFDVC